MDEFKALLNIAFNPSSKQEEAETAFKKARQLALTDSDGWWLMLHPRLKKLHSEPSAHSLSYTPPQITLMPFGKHKGTPLSDLALEHPDYLEWLLENVDCRPALREAIESALN